MADEAIDPWESLDPEHQAVIADRVRGLLPGKDPADHWRSMKPKFRAESLWHMKEGCATDTWSQEEARIVGSADPESQEKFGQLDAPTNLSMAGDADTARRVRLIPASEIKPRPVLWLWNLRVALGTLCLLAGREGIGKSTLAYSLAALITRGRMPGAYFGKSKAVIVAATEDSWEHTIVPRLMAAGADLNLIYRVDVISAGLDSNLVLPSDLSLLERSVAEVGAALILLDPLLSRLDAKLDTHKDAEVRIALEPLVALASRSDAAILGLIHVNKSGGTDALNTLMGSRAFGAVARSVLFAMNSPDDENVKLLGEPKNNLGRSDLPTLTYRIEGTKVAEHDDGDIWTGRIEWMGQSEVTIADALVASGEDSDARSATQDAANWLQDYLNSVGGTAASGTIKAQGYAVGHSARTLDRARKRLRITTEASGFPRQTFWTTPTGGVPDAL